MSSTYQSQYENWPPSCNHIRASPKGANLNQWPMPTDENLSAILLASLGDTNCHHRPSCRKCNYFLFAVKLNNRGPLSPWSDWSKTPRPYYRLITDWKCFRQRPLQQTMASNVDRFEGIGLLVVEAGEEIWESFLDRIGTWVSREGSWSHEWKGQ